MNLGTKWPRNNIAILIKGHFQFQNKYTYRAPHPYTKNLVKEHLIYSYKCGRHRVRPISQG